MQVYKESLIFYNIFFFTQLVLKLFVNQQEILLCYQIFEVAESLIRAKLEPFCDFAADIKYENVGWYLDMQMKCLGDFGRGHLLNDLFTNGISVKFYNDELLFDSALFANLLNQALYCIFMVGLNDEIGTPNQI